MIIALVALLLCAGCGSDEAPRPDPPRARARARGGESRAATAYFTAVGAPDPLACGGTPSPNAGVVMTLEEMMDESEGSCLGAPVPDPETGGCCMRFHDWRPMSRAYSRWVEQYRNSEACRTMMCPSPPVPPDIEDVPPGRDPPAGVLPRCLTQARCEQHRCVSTCPERLIP